MPLFPARSIKIFKTHSRLHCRECKNNMNIINLTAPPYSRHYQKLHSIIPSLSGITFHVFARQNQRGWVTTSVLRGQDGQQGSPPPPKNLCQASSCCSKIHQRRAPPHQISHIPQCASAMQRLILLASLAGLSHASERADCPMCVSDC